MLHIVWRFRAKPDRLDLFRQHYGTDGDWALLFGRSAEYRGTSCWSDASDPLSFLVIDQWTSRAAFMKFREQIAVDYERLDRTCEDFTAEEIKIGEFED